MRERPILFSGEMVRAILEGHKTQTRRVIKPQPVNVPEDAYMGAYNHTNYWCFWVPDKRMVNSVGPNENTAMWNCPYGQTGDRLWVRETWLKNGSDFLYMADDLCLVRKSRVKWKPSLFMPRWASRITLEITDIRVERVQDISPEDAIAEGIVRADDYWHDTGRTPIDEFIKLWDSINAKRGYGWDKNPWIWMIEFRRLKHG